MDPRTERAKEKYNGKEFHTTDGKMRFIVKEFHSGSDIEIVFPDTIPPLVMHKTSYDLSRGIQNHFAKSCIHFDDIKKQYEGSYFRTNEGYIIRILEYNGTSNVKYQMQDQFGYIGITTMQNIRKGEVHNPYKLNKFGGYEGVSIYTNNKKLYDHYYRKWYNMLIRAEGNEYYLQYHEGRTKAYENCYVDPQWLNYSNFAAWYDNKLKTLNPEFDYDLDKDLLYVYYCHKTGGKKCYGPNYCVLIPHDLNVAIVNIASKYYEHGVSNPKDRFAVVNLPQKIKDMATYYHDIGALDNDTYTIIMNY